MGQLMCDRCGESNPPADRTVNADGCLWHFHITCPPYSTKNLRKLTRQQERLIDELNLRLTTAEALCSAVEKNVTAAPDASMQRVFETWRAWRDLIGPHEHIPVAVTPCDRCDGCGWYEGGPTLKTTCERCDGTGVALRERPWRMKVREICERYWNESHISDAEIHAVLENIHRIVSGPSQEGVSGS